MTTQYSPAVDKHIYGIHGCATKQDWLELALAALDQAGLGLNEQSAVQELLSVHYNPEGDRFSPAQPSGRAAERLEANG